MWCDRMIYTLNKQYYYYLNIKKSCTDSPPLTVILISKLVYTFLMEFTPNCYCAIMVTFIQLVGYPQYRDNCLVIGPLLAVRKHSLGNIVVGITRSVRDGEDVREKNIEYSRMF